MTRRTLLAALLWTAAVASCSRHAAPASTSTSARRIVSLAPSMTETLFAIGAGGRVVGRSRFCDWPPEAVAVPVVGGFADADFEAILGLAPDLVVGGPGPQSAGLAEKLDARGIATWFPELASVDAIGAMILELGARTGETTNAKRVVEGMHEQIRSIASCFVADAPPKVLLIVDVNPVVAAGPANFLDDVVRRAGGTNALTIGASWQAVGFERIAEVDPDVIVDAASMDPHIPSLVAVDAPGWRQVRAVREGHIKAVRDQRLLRPGPRVPAGIALLAHALHSGCAAVPG